MEALQQPTLRVAAVIAEGVPEQDTKKLIAYARKHNKIILGPATVGGMQACVSPQTLPVNLCLATAFAAVRKVLNTHSPESLRFLS
jgi:succinyl-CoA synthetase alpha subunit